MHTSIHHKPGTSAYMNKETQYAVNVQTLDTRPLLDEYNKNTRAQWCSYFQSPILNIHIEISNDLVYVNSS